VDFGVLTACSEEALVGIGDVEGGDGVRDVVEGY
jgi:hypothetical protein